MSPWRACRLTAFMAALLLCVGAMPQEGLGQPRPPNVILIMADDLGYEVLGANGGTSYQTPRLDALAAEGVRFTHAYSTPLCTPSRVQIMTGRYGFRNYVEFGYLDPEERTIGHTMQDAGYRTAVVGKWQLQFDDDPETPRRLGFDEHLLWQRRKGDFWHRYKHPIVAGSDAPRDTLFGAYGPEVFVAFIEDFIDRHEEAHEERPFFVYYPMVLVHDPFQPPPGTRGFETHEVVGLNDPAYFGAVAHAMDAAVGRIVDHLDARGLREETLLLFTGDNGTDRDVLSWMGGRAVPGGKGLPLTRGTHVPLIASWPGTIRPRVSDALVDFTDVLPTLADVAGHPLPEAPVVDGHTFYPVLRGAEAAERDWIYCFYDGKGGQFPAGRWAQDRRYKLYTDGRFFDLQHDPEEERPLDRAALDATAAAAHDRLEAVHQLVDAAEQTGAPIRHPRR